MPLPSPAPCTHIVRLAPLKFEQASGTTSGLQGGAWREGLTQGSPGQQRMLQQAFGSRMGSPALSMAHRHPTVEAAASPLQRQRTGDAAGSQVQPTLRAAARDLWSQLEAPESGTSSSSPGAISIRASFPCPSDLVPVLRADIAWDITTGARNSSFCQASQQTGRSPQMFMVGFV